MMDDDFEILSNRDDHLNRHASIPDWKLLDEISIALLELGVGRFDTLQQALPSVVFADIQQINADVSDPHTCTSSRMLKLFRIAQLQLEHLLHSQHELLDALKDERQKNKKLANDNRLLKRSALTSRKRDGKLNEFYKCNACSKTFLNQTFLYEHLLRRHVADAGAQNRIKTVCSTRMQTNEFSKVPTTNCECTECNRASATCCDEWKWSGVLSEEMLPETTLSNRPIILSSSDAARSTSPPTT